MSRLIKKYGKSLMSVMSLLIMFAVSSPGYAVVDGITGGAGPTGPVFNLSATRGYIYTPDADSVLMWGYSDDNAGTPMQYPGPTLIVNQGDIVTVVLKNNLNPATIPLGIKTSLMFPGQSNVTDNGTPGLLAGETQASNLLTVTYTFTAGKPGTYMYHSGTNPEMQTEMGLIGTLIVRPTTAGAVIPGQAYASIDTKYDYEYLFVLTELDPQIHYAVERAQTAAEIDAINNTEHHPVLWFINGRNGPDTLAPAGVPYLPNQPYGSIAQIHPGEQALIRLVNAGRDLHPFHTHGNHLKLLARDGRLLQSAAGVTAGTVDLARFDFTLQAVPGATYDATWTWTGAKMGWDVFGEGPFATCTDVAPADGVDDATGVACHNSCSNQAVCPDLLAPFGFNDNDPVVACFDQFSKEYCPDHGKPFPVQLTNQNELSFGGFYSGSPFFGAFGNLPPGEGGLNLDGGMFYMWHSHNEREIVNNDIYPGGMLTMMIVQPFTVVIPK
ncbi:MAG: multicopper oxidase domain-containing protein [Thiohalomonadales bacterium]